MNMKTRLLSLLLALSLLASLSACGQAASGAEDAAPAEPVEDTAGEGPDTAEEAESEEKSEAADAPAADGLDFSDMEYVRFDDTELKELIEDCRSEMTDAANADAVLDLFDQILDQESELALSYELAELYNSIDVTDEYYSDEASYSSEVYTDYYDQISALGRDILESPCGDAAKESWDADDVDYYADYVEMTDEQLDLYNQEQDLILQFNEASNQDFTTTINGEEYTLYDLFTDSELSEEEYSDGYHALMKSECEVLGPIFVDLVKVRNQLAKSLGYDNYTDYAYEETYDRDYTPEQALELGEYVKKYIVPLYDLVYSYYDYDTSYALDDLIAEMPISDQMDLVREYLPRVNADMVDSFTFMEEHHLYDLEYSDNKLDSGYTTFLSVYDVPFLYNEPGFSFYDLTSLVHEFGHYNSYMVNADTAESYYNIDLAEIHSQGLEMLFSFLYGEMLGEEYAETAEDYLVIQMLGSIMDGCMYDEFQQKVYELEDPTLDQINELFAQVCSGYGYDYNPDRFGCDWVYVSHNFDSPLYYISYAVSALPAFELWEMAQDDYDGACEAYTDLVAHGEVGTYLETLEDCGLGNPFTEDYIKALADTIMEIYPE